MKEDETRDFNTDNDKTIRVSNGVFESVLPIEITNSDDPSTSCQNGIKTTNRILDKFYAIPNYFVDSMILLIRI